MLTYTRMTTLNSVQGLSAEQLDATPPGFINSMGTLLDQVAAVVRLYHSLSL